MKPFRFPACNSQKRNCCYGPLDIGRAEADITPDKKISLAGQFAQRISEYVEKPLTVTALAMECGGEQLVRHTLTSINRMF